MAFVIPNTTDTTGGEEYASLDQAEPDSLDFEILGAGGINGVLSGSAVTTNSSAVNVNVAAGTVVVNGVSYDHAGDSALALPLPAPTDTRFDAVIYRVGTGLTTVQGVESSSNPLFPQSMSVFGGSFDGSIHIDSATDTVLAVCLRVASNTVTAKEIVDKRVMVTAQTIWQGTSLPSSADNGTQFFLTNEVTTGTGVTVSGLYVRANGAWLPIAQSNDSLGVPVGSTIWHNGATAPTGYLLEDGSSYSTATYPDLFAEIGYTFGGSGASFNVPNTINKMVRGSATPATSGGSDSVTLTVNEMPQHEHVVDSHDHTINHDHLIQHSHTTTTQTTGSHNHTTYTDAAGSHQHFEGVYGDGYLSKITNVASGAVAQIPSYAVSYTEAGWVIPSKTDTNVFPSGYNGGIAIHGPIGSEGVTGGGFSGNLEVEGFSTSAGSHSHPNDTSSSNGTHSHSVVVDDAVLSSGPASPNSTSSFSPGTDQVGGGQSFDVLNAYVGKLPCIRAF